MKRYFIIWIGCMMLSWTVSAQQIPISTIFVENPFAFNPAVAGTSNGFKVRMYNRMQWVGFGDGPVTTQLSYFGPHQVRNIGYGGNLNYDKAGPVSVLKLNGAFAYNFAIDYDIRISLGLNLGLIQYRVDGTQFEVFDPTNPPEYAPPTVMANFRPDAGTGVYVYHYDWYVGLSAQQLFNNNLKLSPINAEEKSNRLKTHFFGFAGYRFTDGVTNRLVIEPSVLVRKVVSIPLQMDISGRVIYNQQFWGGLCFRNSFESFDAASIIFGYIHERRIHISLAYDYSFAKIRKYTTGTFELVLGYNFDDVRKGR